MTFDRYQLGDHKAVHWARFALEHPILNIGNLDHDLATRTYMQKIILEDLIECVHSWGDKGDRIVVDELGGYMAPYLSNQGL